MRLRKLLSLPAVAVLALGVAGCPEQQQPADPGPAPPGAAETPAPGAPTPAPETPDAAATPDADERNAAALRAIATAQEAAQNGTAYQIDEGTDNQWQVNVFVGEDRSVEVTVSGDGNTVASTEDDATVLVDEENRERVNRAQTALPQAIEAALAEVPGVLDEAEMVEEDNRDAWQVTIDAPDNDGVEVFVAPEDGSIIKVER